MKHRERLLLGSGFVIITVVWLIAILLLSAQFNDDNTIIPTPRTLADGVVINETIMATSPPIGIIDNTSEIIPATTISTNTTSQNSQTTIDDSRDTPEQSVPDINNTNNPNPNHVPNIAVLHYAPGTEASVVNSYATSLAADVEALIPALHTAVIRLPNDTTNLPDAAFIRRIEHDFYLNALEVPNDPEYSSQWYLDVINAPLGWDMLPETVTPVTVAVVDSGICFNNPDLQGQILGSGWDFVADDNDATDEYGHGCEVSSVLAANHNNNIAIAGVASHVQILPVRVLDESGAGTYSNLAQAIVYAVDNGAQIINLSLGGTSQSLLLANAIAYAESHGVLVIAAAGNQGSTQAPYPAAYDSVVAVGAVNENLDRASFSNYGDWVDIYAPGTNIRTIGLDGHTKFASGTSLAVPQVTGVAAIEMALGRSLVVDGGIVSVQAATSTPPVDDGGTETCSSPEITEATVALDALVEQYLADPTSVSDADLESARATLLALIEECYSTAYDGDIIFDGGGYAIASPEPIAQYSLFGTKWGEDSPFDVSRPPGTRGGTITYSFMPANVVVRANRNTETLTFGFGRLDDNNPDTEICLQEYAREVISEWASYANIDLEEVPDSGLPFNSSQDAANHIRIGFIDIDRPGKTLGLAYFPPEEGETNSGVGDIFLDIQEDWAWHCTLDDEPHNGAIDFGIVLRHELGHSLGLAHQERSRRTREDIVPSVMSPRYNDRYDALQADDIAGFRAIYGTDSLGPIALNAPNVNQNSVDLSWTPSTGGNPDSFEIQVVHDDGDDTTDREFDIPDTLVFTTIQTANSRTVTSLLNGDYRWRVRGYREGEGWGPWSGATNATFTISVEIPVLIRPINEAFLRSGVVDFIWSEISSDTQYVLQIDDNDGFSDPLVYMVGTSETFETSGTDALVNGDYYWRVRNLASGGNDWSEVRFFRVDANVPETNPPASEDCAMQPVTGTDSDVLVCTTDTVTLDWSPADGAVEYQIHMDTSPYFVGLLFLDTLFLDTLYGDSLFLDTLFLDTLYGDTLFLDTLFLDTLFLDTLFLDTLFLDTLFLDTLFLDTLFLDTLFLDTLFLDTQRLESIFADRLFLDTVFIDQILGTSNQVTNLTDGYHYWRVRAVQADGSVGPWSTPNVFVVDTDRNDVAINEIFPGEPAWIEVVNSSPQGIGDIGTESVDLNGWEIILYNPQGDEFFRYTFDTTVPANPDPDAPADLFILEPGEYLVLMAEDAPTDISSRIPNTIYLGADSITIDNWPLEDNPEPSSQTSTATITETTSLAISDDAFVSTDITFTGGLEADNDIEPIVADDSSVDSTTADTVITILPVVDAEAIATMAAISDNESVAAFAIETDTRTSDEITAMAVSVITVETTTSEFVDDDLCSLPEAIVNANNDAATYDDCPAGSGADTIELASFVTYSLTLILDTSDGDNGLPSITSEIIINGNNSWIWRSYDPATDDFRIFHIASTGDLTLNDVTVRNGRAIDGITDTQEPDGGGIYNSGSLTLNNSTLSGNTSGANGSGGAIYNFTTGSVTLINSTLTNNSTIRSGGGIFSRGSIIIIDSTISNNFSTDRGGGISNYGTAILTNSTISNNTANSSGGGISNVNNGDVTLADSTISNNTSITNSGGGIFSTSGTVTLTNSTIVDNTASNQGGGLFNAGTGTLTLNDSIVSNNTASNQGGGLFNSATATGRVVLTNSTVSGNTSSNQGGGLYNSGTTTLTDSTVSYNTTDSSGGGIFNSSNSGVTLTNSTVSSNFAISNGGGIYNSANSILNLTDSTIASNTTSRYGGGIYNIGTATLTNSTVSDNTASWNGGGINIGTNGTMTLTNSTVSNNTTGSSGGGVFIDRIGSNLTMTNSTVSSNSASGGGGGIFTYNILTTTNSTLFNNSSGFTGGGIYTDVGDKLTLTNTIIAGSIGGANCYDDGTFITTFGTNFDTDGTCDGFTEVTTGELNLDVLDYYGGATQTHRLGTGSVAIDAVATGDCTVAADQRGIIRPDTVANRCDVGAYEIDGSTLQTAPDYIVNTVHTGDDGRCSVDQCTLIEAINAANADGLASTITLANDETYILKSVEAVASGDNGLPLITSPIEIFGNNATIQRSNIAVAFRIFYVDATGDLILRDVTIDFAYAQHDGAGLFVAGGGQALLINVDMTNNWSDYRGGAIYNAGTLDIAGGAFTDNHANQHGGGIANNNGTVTITDNTTFTDNSVFGLGGVIYNTNNGSVTLTDATLSRNTANNSGGAIYGDDGGTITLNTTTLSQNAANYGAGIMNSGSVFLSNSTVTENEATFNGGGIYNSYGTVEMSNTSQVSQNTANYGAGIYNDNGGIILTDSEVSQNSANNNGGGIFNIGFDSSLTLNRMTLSGNTARWRGGGIFNDGGEITVNTSALLNNTANSFFGGGISNESGTANIANSTFSGNKSWSAGTAITNQGVLTLTNSTIYENESIGFPDNRSSIWNNSSFEARNTIIGGSINSVDCFFTGGSVTALGTNFDTDGTCGSFTTVVSSELNLGTLADNGGSTQTYALLFPSVAIDAVAGGECTTGVDQRGALRQSPVGGLCDVGAVEITQTLQTGPDFTVNTIDMRDDRSCTTLHCSLIDAINAANADGVISTITLQNGAIYTLTEVIDTSDGNNGLPSITTPMTINANNATIVRNDQNIGESNIGSWTSLQLDSNGNAIISYYDNENEHLKLSICDTALCRNPYVTTVDAEEQVGRYSSLQLDSNGNPIISYFDSENASLKLAICDSPACINPLILTIDSDNAGSYTSLALDGDNPVISYRDVNNNNLKLAECDSPACANPVITTVDSGATVGEHTSLVLNSTGVAFISYYNDGDLKLAVCDIICNTYTVDDSTDVGMFSSIALDSTGNPVMSYYDSFNTNLKLAVCNDAVDCDSPTIETVDSGVSVGQFTSLELDTGNSPIISYWDLTYDYLKIAVCDDATCTTPQVVVIDSVDGVGGAGKHTSLALNDDGYPVMSYLGNFDGAGVLNLATCDSLLCPSPLLRTLDGEEATPDFRIFHVAATGDLTLEDVTVSNGQTTSNGAGIYNLGSLTLSDSTLSDHTSASNGGAIYIALDAFATITNTTVTNNTANSSAGGGITNEGTLTLTGSTISGNIAGGSGGGIYIAPDSFATITNTTVTNNRAGCCIGGGIFVRGTLTLTASTISDNVANTSGGGIYIWPEGSATVTNSTVSNNTATGSVGGGIAIQGILNVSDSTISGNTAQGSGGGIRLWSTATVAVTNSTVSNNTSNASAGGGILAQGTLTLSNSTVSNNTADTNGGGIFTHGTTTITTNSLIDGNTAERGGGIYNEIFDSSDGDLTIENSIISNNTANDRGGGVYNNDGTLTIADSIISGNEGLTFYAGGILHNAGMLTITDTLIDGNQSTTLGGGLFIERNANFDITRTTFINNVSTAHNGGAAEIRGTGTISNSTITRNRAAGRAGGIVTSDADLTLNNVTIAFNEAGGLVSELYTYSGIIRLRNTLVVGNTSLPICRFGGGSIIDEGSNLQYRTTSPADASCGATIPVTNPQLGALTGSRFFYPLLISSPAIDNGSPITCETVDQLSQPRDDGACDIGAIEFRDSPQTDGFYNVTVTAMEDDGLCGIRHCSLIEAIDAANTFTADDADLVSIVNLGSQQEYDLTTVHTFRDGGNGLPVISGRIILRGNDSTIRRVDAAPEFRFFYVIESANLRLQNVTLRNGISSIMGGGAAYNLGTLNLDNAHLNENTALVGGAIRSGDGTIPTVLNITSSQIRDNNATNVGGAIAVFNSAINIETTTIDGNLAINNGGAIYADNTTGIISKSTVSNNTAPIAAGVIASQSSLTLLNTTLSNNLGGSGFYQGIGGNSILRHVTVAYNSIGLNGNGGSITVENSLVVNNPNGDDPAPSAPTRFDCAQTITTLAVEITVTSSIATDTDCATASSSGGFTPFPPIGENGVNLMELGNYGGLSQTHALPLASIAVGYEAIDIAICNEVGEDQRSQNRTETDCDVGAFERSNIGLPEIGTTGGSVALMQPSAVADFVHFGSAQIPDAYRSNFTGGVVSLPLDGDRSIGRDPVGGDTDDRTDWFTQMPTRGGQNAVRLVINEIFTGDIDAIEIYNPSIHPINVSGWQVTIHTAGYRADDEDPLIFTYYLDTYTYTFAPQTVFPPGAFVVLKEGSAPLDTEGDNAVYMGFEINWPVSGAQGIVELTNGVSGVDYMRFGNDLEGDDTTPASPILDILPTNGTRWFDPDPTSPLPQQSIGRDNRSTDTDRGYDWIVQRPSLGTRNTAESVPPNDEFENPLIIPYVPFRDIRSVQAATLDIDDVELINTAIGDGLWENCGVDVHHTVWYKLPPQGTDKVTTFQTDGSSYNTSLSIWREIGGNLVLEDCDSNSRGDDTRSRVAIQTLADETYYIMIGSTFGRPGRLVFSVDPPANDDFNILIPSGESEAEIAAAELLAAEFTIDILPYSNSQITRAASSAADDPAPRCGTMVGRTVWYRYEPQTSNRVRLFTEGSSYDTVIAVYTGETRGNLLPFACANDSSTASWSELEFRPVVGTTYWIMVGGNNDSGGNLVFQLEHVTPPPNDNWENAIDTPLDSGLFFHQVDTYGATNQANDPTPSVGNRPSNSVWYRYTGITSARVTFETLTSNYNTVLSVWTTAFDGDTVMPDDFVEIISNDDAGIGVRTSRLTLNPLPGETYYIMVSGYLGDTGLLNFTAYYPDTPPPHDLLLNAREIPYLTNGDPVTGVYQDSDLITSGATLSINEDVPSCIPTSATVADSERFGNSVWYRYQARNDVQQLHFTTAGSFYDTVLTVWVVNIDVLGNPITNPDTGLPELLEVACNNDSNGNLTSSLVVPTGSNTTLYIQVSSFLPGGGILNFEATALPLPPDNDLTSGIIEIVNLPYTYSDSTVQATSSLSDPNPSCGLTVGNTVWFLYQPDSDAALLFDTQGSEFDTVLSIWTQELSEDGTLVFRQRACDNNTGSGATSFIEFAPEAGQAYYIMIGGENRANDDYTLNVEERTPPDNDEQSGARSIRGGDASPIEITQSTRGATTNTLDPVICNVTVGRTVWYSYTTGASDEIVHLSTVGSNFNTVIAVFDASGQMVACADNNGAGFTELINALRIPANTTYTMMLGGAFAETGTVHLSVDVVIPPDNDEIINPHNVPVAEVLDTTYATRNAATDGTMCGTSPENTVWYTYTPATDMTLSVSLAGTSYGTVIAVLDGDALLSCSIGQQHTQLTSGGSTYRIMIGSIGGQGGMLHITATAAETPANDIRTNPIVIPSIPAFDTGATYSNNQSTAGATSEDDATFICNSDVGKGVWYQYTAVAGDGLLVFDTAQSNYSSVIVVFPDDGTVPFCDESEHVEFAAQEGTTYLIMVAGLNGESGDLVFRAYQHPRPANDDFVNAILVPSLPYPDTDFLTVDTRGASDMPADPSSCQPGSGKSVWYYYESRGFGPLTINALIDPLLAERGAVISVYTGEYGGLIPVECGTGTATVQVEPLQTYYILITDADNSGGDLQIAFDGNVVPPPPALSVTLVSDIIRIAEPGGIIPFTVTITNDSILETADVLSLTGDVPTDIATRCGFPITLLPSASTTCTYDYLVEGVPFSSVPSTVTANAITDTSVSLIATDTVNIIITDIPSSLFVTLVADVPAVTASGVLVGFTASIENTSLVDDVTITQISDRFGTEIIECTVPNLLQPGEVMTCDYERPTDDTAGLINIFTVLVSGVDDDSLPLEVSAATQVIIQCPRLNDRRDVDVDFDDPYNTAIITNNSSDCVYNISMLAYRRIGRGQPEWVLDDSISRYILPGASATLSVTLPECRSQVMIIEGEIFEDDVRYGNRRLVHRNLNQNIRCDSDNPDILPEALPPLAAPSELTGIATETQVLLSWLDNNADESNHHIERQTSDGTWLTLATLAENEVTFMDSNLTCATTYIYRVWANNDVSISDYSNAVSATTTACIISTPPATDTPEVDDAPPVFVGLYRDGIWRFRNGRDEASAEVTFNFGLSETGWQPVIGDWNGDGSDDLGLYKDNTWILRDTTLTDSFISFGESGWQPVVGDWNGDGSDDLGLYQSSKWQLYDRASQTITIIDFGTELANAVPVAADWNNDGSDSLGFYSNGQWTLLNSLADIANTTTLAFGPVDSAWLPLVGDWNGDTSQTVGLFFNGMWRLRNALSDGQSDIGFNFGFNESDWLPVTGFNTNLQTLATIGTGSAVTLPEVTPTPEVTAEVVPSDTPSPEATVEITPEVTAETIPSDTMTPETTAEVTPEITPEVTAEIVPTDTPSPETTAEVLPTDTPSPEVTVEVVPTDTPSPEATTVTPVPTTVTPEATTETPTPLEPRVEICHATGGQDGTANNWVILELPHSSLFNHFDESLNPLPDHALDFIINDENPAASCG